jgi:predicted phosphoribosyltransferase/dienelactone hydrolase
VSTGLPFADRREAGEALAAQLDRLAPERPIVLALPRGGVPVAAEVAARLRAPLDVLMVRKLGVPFHPELAMGAIGEDGSRVLEPTILRSIDVTARELAEVEARERHELERRGEVYRAGRPLLPIQGRTVIIVDDGIATGSTARVAVEIARHRGAARVVLATPVAAPDTADALEQIVDAFICVATPTHFSAVGQWYRDFSQVGDDEVIRLLAEAQDADPDAPASEDDIDRDVELAVDGVTLRGHLTVPAGARGVVVFAHGSGSSAQSPRNRQVAEHLHRERVGTLLFDLLTPAEAEHRPNVFDIELLTRRLVAATHWLEAEIGPHAVGFFGASTGAAAALRAAADPGITAHAVVSRGGRVDLAGDRLAAVTAPTLLIVGGADPEVLALNRQATRLLRCRHHVMVVPGAGHLFEGPGELDAVAHAAATWFAWHLPSRSNPTMRGLAS